MQAAAQPEVPSAAFDRAIQELRPVPRWLDVLWFVALVVTAAGFVPAAVLPWVVDLMLISGLFATILGLAMLRWLLSQVRPTLRCFWEQSVVSHAEQPIDNRIADAPGWRRKVSSVPHPTDDDIHSSSTRTEAYYLAFLRSVNDEMNHWLGLGVGALFALAILLSYIAGYGYVLDHWRNYLMVGRVAYLIMFLGSMFVAFVLGCLAWRMTAVAIKAAQLSWLFDFNIQVQHPDQCGGLGPLRDLLYRHAMAIAVGGLFLGAWALMLSVGGALAAVGGSSGSDTCRPLSTGIGRWLCVQYTEYDQWIGSFYSLSLFIASIGLIAFIYPAVEVSLGMTRSTRAVRRQVVALGLRIMDESNKTLGAEQWDDDDGLAKLSTRLSRLTQVYSTYADMPVWLFGKKKIGWILVTTSLTLLTSQLTKIVPEIIREFR